MIHRRFVLTFPPAEIEEPITYNLIKKFDIMVNIVRADISPGKIGHLVVEMTAPAKVLKEGMAYIRQQNVDCELIEKKISYREDLCIHCGACRAVCPVCACAEDAKCLELHDERDAYAISMYNLIRILHLMDSCIHCGQCEEVCPVDIPLTLIQRRFSERMQRHLEYTPGMDVAQTPPLNETKLRWRAEVE